MTSLDINSNSFVMQNELHVTGGKSRVSTRSQKVESQPGVKSWGSGLQYKYLYWYIDWESHTCILRVTNAKYCLHVFCRKVIAVSGGGQHTVLLATDTPSWWPRSHYYSNRQEMADRNSAANVSYVKAFWSNHLVDDSLLVTTKTFCTVQ